MWFRKHLNRENFEKMLIPAVKEVVIEQAINEINKRLDKWEKEPGEFVKNLLKDSVKKETNSFVQSEEFIDKIVIRIKNKQLGAD